MASSTSRWSSTSRGMMSCVRVWLDVTVYDFASFSTVCQAQEERLEILLNDVPFESFNFPHRLAAFSKLRKT